MSRFDYIAYDDEAARKQASFKHRCADLEDAIEANLKPGRAKSLAITKLEEVYMWIGKQIRDDQIARNSTADLQESRNNG